MEEGKYICKVLAQTGKLISLGNHFLICVAYSDFILIKTKELEHSYAKIKLKKRIHADLEEC